jgi:biotin carboxyl carrier protein
MKAIINGKEYEVTLPKDGSNATINGKEVKLDWYSPAKGMYHFLFHSKSYNAEVVEYDENKKSVIVKINNRRIAAQLKDESDELLEKLGIVSSIHKTETIKAPMPGLVLQVMVKVGDTVQKSDGLLVLEAMKMENLLKPPSNGVIKAIHVTKGMKVEKNQVLMEID